MPENDNQQVTTPRSSLIERMKGRYPDRDYVAAAGENGETSEESKYLLEQDILNTLDEYERNRSESDAKNKALNELFFSDPRSAEFIQTWIETGDPRAAFVESFGDELSDLASEEGRNRFPEALKSWRDRKAENDRLAGEADANWNKTLEDLDAWGESKGLSNDKKVSVILKLVSIAANGTVNKYGTEDFDMVLRDMNYDEAVDQARHEGEVAGRNAKIDENKMRRQSTTMPPSISGGQGMAVAEKREEPKSIFSGIE